MKQQNGEKRSPKVSNQRKAWKNLVSFITASLACSTDAADMGDMDESNRLYEDMYQKLEATFVVRRRRALPKNYKP